MNYSAEKTQASNIQTASGTIRNYEGPISIDLGFAPKRIIANVAIHAVGMAAKYAVYNVFENTTGEGSPATVMVDRYRNSSYQFESGAELAENGIVNWTPFIIASDLGQIDLEWVAYGE